ncbi:CerR family C-terminal domain-containing protein [Oricola sp.]|uniref:CerR family C-terminal domain-containing protein n=1 Tax=Oricola sp. TaxID=1979950 RepID=UPI0025E903D7|nr:CerR family C-terminal domain-containing protein [Oricola sp.]MCI5077665.1 CerR family C-terminal domain-containing protein [Oricola sp.]
MKRTEPPKPETTKDGDTSRKGASRKRSDRGAETRAQLIEAALDIFGRLGYEGATTRQIAKAANANLAAIVYHFGSKEALHLAVAEHVVKSILARIGPTLAVVATPEAAATPQSARDALHRLIGTVADVLLGSAEAERWARFIVREQLQPTAAFDVIYGYMDHAISTALRLVSVVLDVPEDDDLRLRAITVLGQVLVFRVAQTLVLRRMNWTVIGEPERKAIKKVILQNLDAILEGTKS